MTRRARLSPRSTDANASKTEFEQLEEIRARRNHESRPGVSMPYPTGGGAWTRPDQRVLDDIDFLLRMIDENGLGR